MAAGNWVVYGPALEAINKATLDLDSGTYRMVLVTSAYTPNQSTHAAWSSISASEVASGGGYATHGKLLTCTVSRSANVVTFDCDDQSWAASTITAKYAVIVNDANADGALAAGDVPLAYVDLDTGGGSLSSTAAAFSVGINASGVFTVTAATS
ncbi:hypothetical protein [Hoeflea sp.]|uniref:hypothetical protein n=1 Tax=Hoeflea sp. TaxID=1940281 RepID=UPI0019AD31B6|nr:hypothetical protein [Hoeflea sp.]MBC7282580.1 hypothetical protein [Hoeflea sp.]